MITVITISVVIATAMTQMEKKRNKSDNSNVAVVAASNTKYHDNKWLKRKHGNICDRQTYDNGNVEGVNVSDGDKDDDVEEEERKETRRRNIIWWRRRRWLKKKQVSCIYSRGFYMNYDNFITPMGTHTRHLFGFSRSTCWYLLIQTYTVGRWS